MAKLKIKFNRAYRVKDGGGATYKEGQVVSLDEASARHFITRGVAESYVAKSGKSKDD